MKNVVLKNDMVVSMVSTNKEAKLVKQAEEKKDRKGIELMVLSSIIMDYFTHTATEEYLYSHSDEDIIGTLTKKVKGECLTQHVHMYRNIPQDVILISNAILEGKISKAVKLAKKADLRINLSKLLDVKLITQFNDWDINICRLNERYAY
jgi:hypothetical protein